MNKSTEDKIKEGLNAFRESGGSIDEMRKDFLSRIEAKEPPRNGRRILIWILLTILFGLVIGYVVTEYDLFKKTVHPPNVQQMFASHFDMPPPIFSDTQRGDLSVIPSEELSIDIGNNAYINGNYKKAISYWLQSDNLSSKEQLCLAAALIEEKEGQQAIKTLEKINDPQLEDMIDWYYAMAYLQIGDQMNAKRLLYDIITNSSNHYKASEAKQILSQLP